MRICFLAVAGAFLTACSDTSGPTPLAAPVVSVGWETTCALNDRGRAFCWGQGAQGVLGNDADTDAALPVPVAGNHTFVSIGVGSSHACALSVDGVAYCWGRGQDGRLGTGPDTTPARRPVAVAGDLRFRSLSVGSYHTCGITHADELYCWGVNESSEIGDTSRTPVCRYDRCADTPLLFSASMRFRTVTATFGTTCGVATTGIGYCWGGNYGGAAGADTSIKTVITPNAFSLPFIMFAAGGPGLHTCGLDESGRAYCWGYGYYGQLGNGTSGIDAVTSTPQAVSADLRFSSLAVGAYFSCGLVTNGAVVCWGSASSLGNSLTTQSNTPLAVAAADAFQSMAAGQESACAVSRAGEIVCWGWKEFGLGDGSQLSLRPVSVALP